MGTCTNGKTYGEIECKSSSIYLHPRTITNPSENPQKQKKNTKKANTITIIELVKHQIRVQFLKNQISPYSHIREIDKTPNEPNPQSTLKEKPEP